MATLGGIDEQRLARLIQAGRGLLSELDLDVILDRLLQTAADVTGARYAALGILDDERVELARFLTRGIDPTTHRVIGDLPRGRGILGILIDDPRPLRLDDVGDHPRSYGFPPGHPPMHSFLGVPILIRGQAWGNLYLTEKQGAERFSAGDEEAVVVLADWAAIAIENARLYREVSGRRDELERAVSALEATTAIAQAVGAETDLARVLELVVKRARALVDAHDVLIMLRDGDALVIAAGAGYVQVTADARLPLDGSTAGTVLAERRSRRIDDAAHELRIPPERFGLEGASTALLVPLVYRGQGLGVLAAFDRLSGEGAFTDEDQRLLEAFAVQAATAVATAKTVETDRLRRSLAAGEAERRRWARELHDDTLQALAALRVHISRAARLPDADAMRAAVRDAAGHLADEIESLRSLIAELRPPALDQLGLEPALSSLVQRTADGNDLDITAEVDLDGGAALAPDLETTIYRVVQESLTNAVKHARAGAVTVSVRRADGEVDVAVADDGVGFDPGRVEEGHFGLVGIRERVELAGGQLTVERGPGGGTRIHARLPVA